jgi:DegV family protein with EDD domain
VELTRTTTAIVLDSTSDFVDAPERHANMRVVPLYVLFDGEPLRDHVDISSEQFYERLASASSLPTTSQPTPADFLAVYEELVAAGYTRIWSLHLTSKLSGTHESAVRAAEELGGDVVRVVDTETASLACALLAEAIDRRLDRGSTDEEVEQLVERFLRHNGVVFTVGTLEYLQKGGRIGKGQALAGSLLNVKPILSVEDGVIVPIARARGRQNALKEFEQLFTADTEDREGLRVAIAHANAPEWIGELTEVVTQHRPKATIDLIEPLGAVVGTHAGPGSVGFFWFQDEA